MRFFILQFLIVGFLVKVQSQDTFVKTYDFFDEMDETARNMFVVGDTVYILGTGDCDKGRCLHFYKMTIDGEVFLKKRYPDIVPSSRIWHRDSTFLIGGAPIVDSMELRDGFSLFELDKFGNVLNASTYNDINLGSPEGYEVVFYWQRGVIANDDKIIIYGDVYEDDGGSTQDNGGDDLNRGMLVYLNNDLSFDTLVYIDPVFRNMEMWDADLTAEGHFSFLYDYDEWDGVSDDFRDRIHYRTFAEYDTAGKELYRWDPPELFYSGFLYLSQLILSNGDRILHITRPGGTPSHDLIRVNKEGEILWRHNQRFSDVTMGIGDISETIDGNILLAGYTDEVNYDQSSLLRKIDASDGSIMWDRAYTDWTDPTSRNGDARSTFFKAKELPDGTILAAGLRDNNTYAADSTILSHDDLQLFRVDSVGCLEPGCGGYEQIVTGRPPWRHPLMGNHYWQLQDASSPTGLTKKRYHAPSGLGGLINERKTEIHVDINANIWEVRQDRIFRVENETKRIYYIEAWESDPNTELLLYDFSLEVGDIFESDYIEHPLQVIETDTMRLTDKSKSRYWILACTENPENTIRWIERIGTYHGVVWPPEFCSGDYGPETLTCYYWHRRFTHMNPDVSGCLMPSSTDNMSYESLSAITVSPNPTSDRITITVPSDVKIERIELMDTHGRTHLQQQDTMNREVVIDLYGYPSGLYFITIDTDKGRVVKKVLLSS